MDKNEHFRTLPDSDDDFELPPPPKKLKEDRKKRRDVESCIPMEFGTKGGYHHLILILGSGLSNFMTIVKLLKYPFQTRK
jgi:hypothetical protein